MDTFGVYFRLLEIRNVSYLTIPLKTAYSTKENSLYEITFVRIKLYDDRTLSCQ